MKYIKNTLLHGSLIVLLLSATACNQVNTTEDMARQADPVEAQIQSTEPAESAAPLVLPVKYQTPNYMVDLESQEVLADDAEATVRVGASIRSTTGPLPLWQILKRLAALKQMNVSWASDVDQQVLVDVDISASDDYYRAIDNLLRQVDYYHEVQNNTIIVKYKDVKRFYIAMPFTNSTYTTRTGGNILGSDEESSNVDGTIELTSTDNEFDLWSNIQANMDKIINTWNTQVAVQEAQEAAEEEGEDEITDTPTLASRQVSSGSTMYIIDKPIGMITVTAPRPLLERLEEYFDALKSEIYKQIAIEAKIIEVQLSDSSSIGINWTEVLNAFAVTGTVEFGYNGQVYPFISANESPNPAGEGYNSYGLDYDTYNGINAHQSVQDPGRFVSKVSLNPADFTVFLNALKSQGDTKILSNPKISVMNGQPALITVGRNVTYVDEIEADRETGSNSRDLITYTVETERILSGIGMALTASVLDDDTVIMNLVPVTSELIEPIQYIDIGSDGGTVGLPIVNVREMSTTVKVKDGEMLVIGGLISEVEETEGEFAPVLGDIPLVRYLFGHEDKIKQKRELIILLKPRII